MDQFKHFLHLHNLSFIEVGKDDDSVVCLGCANIILAEHAPRSLRSLKLPPEIQRDVLHPHPLIFNLREMIVCDGCGRLSASFYSYRCMNCELSLDLGCAVAFSNADELKFHEALQGGGKIKTKARHFSHNHHLTCCKFLLPTTEMAMNLFKGITLHGMQTGASGDSNLYLSPL
ncbi:hypothetical protein HRI_001551900 [Hibiscus trionum]|uniref:DC1 domain-containing protein n=1 Tax=Hibiscus trionum TaxID=183268 RepID=A0A9W7HK44_HIBTR|nr:hypothetical protein HRI_001551900 [Hibiscus trionum]